MEFDVRKKMAVAAYIRGITNENDKIWTTEADIAFFAGRMIVTPQSEVWKFQGFYEDLWGYFGKTYIGYTNYPEGLVTIDEFQRALEEEKPKIVVMLTEFKVTDYLVWNGIENPNSNQTGLANYILTHYYLNCTLYDMEIYVRNQTQ